MITLQMMEAAVEQGVWAGAQEGQLWAAQRLGPAGAPPAEVWRALTALGAAPARMSWLSSLLLVRLAEHFPETVAAAASWPTSGQLATCRQQLPHCSCLPCNKQLPTMTQICCEPNVNVCRGSASRLPKCTG